MNAPRGTWVEALSRPGIREADVRNALGARYEVLAFVGTGAAACVLKVADLSAGREVRAAKLSVLNGRPDARQAARAEFALAARFNHPNLARYFDLDIPPGGPLALTTMEFVDGVPFGAGAAAAGAAAAGRDAVLACGVMVEVLRGLAFLHDAGLVHGDVKPGNVLCGVSDGRPYARLLDFHLTVRAAGPDQAPPGARGTLRYMAPEVVAGGTPEARSDLYSAGVMLFEALTGRRLFDGAPGELAAQHLAAPAARMQDAGALAGVLERLLSKHPEGRYRTASEAIAAIEEAAGTGRPAETPETLLGRVRSAPLVGREAALRAFDQALEPPAAVPPEPARAVLVRARAGLGRSRFLRECQVRAQCAGLHALRLEGPQTADGLLDAVERWAGGTPPPHRAAALPAASGGLPEGPAEGTVRLPPALLRRCNAVTDRLVANARARPAALLVDDVHALPPDAVECLLFLMRGTLRNGMGFGLTVPDGAPVNDAVSTALEAWRRDGLLVEVALEELSRQDRRTLVRAALPSATPAAAVEALADGGGGSPEVIGLTLEHVIAHGALSAGPGGGVRVREDLAASLPDGLSALLADAAGALDEQGRGALRLLAVGGEVPAAALAAAAGLEAHALLPMLRTGPAARLVSCRPTDRGTLCKLQHPRLADALLEGTTRAQQKRLHDRLADALAAAGDEAAVARHRLQGRTPGEGVRLVLALLSGEAGRRPHTANLELVRLALARARGPARRQLLEAAGDLESARGRFPEAVELLEKAARPRDLAAPDRVRLLRKLGHACTEAGRYAEARRILHRALAACDECTAPQEAERANITLLLGGADCYEGKYAESQNRYEEAARLARELGDECLTAKTLHGLGLVHLEQRALEQSEQALVQAARGLQAAGLASDEAAALAALGYVAMLGQRWDRATELIGQALPKLQETGNLRQLARALVCLGSVHQKGCGWAEAAQHYEAALAISERLGHLMGCATALVNLSQLHASSGLLEAAIAGAEDAAALLPGDHRVCCHAMTRLARAQYALGDLPAAWQSALTVIELAEASGLEVLLESGHRTLGEIAALRCQWFAAREHLRTALTLCEERHWKERHALGTARLAEVMMSSGERPAAYDLACAARAEAEASSHEPVLAVAQTVRGKILLAMGRADEALAELSAASSFFERARVWDEIAEVSLLLALSHMRLGRPRFAMLHLRTALDNVERVASHLLRPGNRAVFLADPRRQALFDAASALNAQVAES